MHAFNFASPRDVRKSVSAEYDRAHAYRYSQQKRFRIRASAGTGTIGISGRIGALAPNIPLDLTVTARNAEPIQSDLLTARFDTNIHVSGAVATGIKASGLVHILRADTD